MISPELLRRFPLFAGLPPSAFKDIAMFGSEISVRAGDWVFVEGDPADSLCLLLSGQVDLKINLGETGDRHADLSRLVDGDLVGWSALVDPYIYTVGALANTDARLARLDAQKLRGYLDDNPAIGYMVMRQLAQEIGRRLTNLRVQFVSLTGA